jgi:glycosyltransferase involved in cell wall biosynthesis
MRVLHVYSGNLFGGIEGILLAIARGASTFPGVEHEFALAFHGRLENDLIRAGATVHHLGAVRVSRPGTVRTARAALAKVLQSATYDRTLCHAPWAEALFGRVVRRAGVPLVFWAHDVMTGRHWTERLARRVVPDLAICNSSFTAGTLSSLYPAVRSAVVYAPVEARPAATNVESRRIMRQALDTPADAVVIIQASRSERWKGHALLIEALAALRHIPGWLWWQAGGAQRPAEAAFLASLKRSAKRLGVFDRVRWLGERDDVPSLLAAADIYCQPNIEPEPFGVVFVEALAAGLPVVTARLGGPQEIVDDSCGVLVEPRDPAALAATLQTLIENPSYRARLGAAAPARARQLCDPAAALTRLGEVLSGMAPVEAGA